MSPFSRFRSYLAGLVLATLPAIPSLAATPPPAVRPKVAFAGNLADKLAAAAPLQVGLAAVAGPGGGFGETTPFGEVWVQYGPFNEGFIEFHPWTQINHASPLAASPLSPSQVFDLISRG